jgi:N-acetylglutamate synthase-like GNAT family acetyltransferase
MSGGHLVPARPDDLSEVVGLLTRFGLPLGGLTDQFPDAVVVVRANGAVVACAGLERHGRSGLLRSLAVDQPFRDSGLGAALVGNRVAVAASSGLDAVYLLTTNAATYFERLGFVAAQRATVPAALAASVEFNSACPATAACLVLPLSSTHRASCHSDGARTR